MLAHEVNDAPAAITLLYMSGGERRYCRTPETTTKKNGKDCSISQPLNRTDVRRAQERLGLPKGQPVAGPDAHRLRALNAGNAGRQLGREQPIIRGLSATYFANTGIVVSVPSAFARNPITLILPPAGVKNSMVPR